MTPQEQAARITPPRKNTVLAITLDTNVRAYDITGLSIGGFTPDAGAARHGHVFVTIQAQTADAFFYFHTATDSALSTTDAISAGAAAVYGATHCLRIPAGEERTYFLDRSKDKFLVVKGSAAGVLRLFASSSADSPNGSEL